MYSFYFLFVIFFGGFFVWGGVGNWIFDRGREVDSTITLLSGFLNLSPCLGKIVRFDMPFNLARICNVHMSQHFYRIK